MSIPLRTARLCLTSALVRPCQGRALPSRLALGKSYGSILALCQRSYNTQENGQGPVQRKLIYEGPLDKTAKYLKRFSIASLSATVLLAPLIMTLDSGLGMEIRTVLAGSALATSGVSTGLIHWALYPYITKLSVIDTLRPVESLSGNSEKAMDANAPIHSISTSSGLSADTLLEVETLGFFGRSKVRSVFVHDLERSNRVFTVWKVKDQAKSAGLSLAPWGQVAPYAPAHTMFFAHEEGHHFRQMAALFDIISGKAASLQGRAQILQQQSNNAH
ncbi:hypothetical protein IWQ61_001944 [Dispira simplex]|nr:hypothetical protein IWQ61_001944 [Dispira simplex]